MSAPLVADIEALYIKAYIGKIVFSSAYIGKIVLSSHRCPFIKKLFFSNQTPSCICSMCPYGIGKVSNCSIKSCGRS